MPRYFVTTANGFVAHDEEGVEVSDLDALRTMLCRTLARILHDEGCGKGQESYMTYAADESGRLVMTATISVAVTTS